MGSRRKEQHCKQGNGSICQDHLGSSVRLHCRGNPENLQHLWSFGGLSSHSGHAVAGSSPEGRDLDKEFAQGNGRLYTIKSGGESFTGWNDTSYMIWGTGMPAANSFTDLIANCKMIIYWGVDHSGKGWVSWESNPVLRRYKAAGVKLVVIDPWFNETAAMNADKYISINPDTLMKRCLQQSPMSGFRQALSTKRGSILTLSALTKHTFQAVLQKVPRSQTTFSEYLMEYRRHQPGRQLSLEYLQMISQH